ncbi:MAG: RtcB family protein [Clostridia bacterium]|nr:RtcB family protein [Clostridia bacterium]
MKNDLYIFTENIEPDAINQIYNLIVTPPFQGQSVRIMPDVHYGKGCVVGFTSTFTDKIIPNVLGVDLGCGMLTVELGNIDIDLEALDQFIKARIPAGSKYGKESSEAYFIKNMHCYPYLRDMERLLGSLGTLGGGNHFIEIDTDENGCKYLIIHSGSRNLGLQVAKHYQKMAFDSCKDSARLEREAVVARLNAESRPDLIPVAIAEVNAKYAHKTKIPADYCYLEGAQMQMYLDDLRLCQRFASLSRRKMADEIIKHLKLHGTLPSFETVHNFIDADNIIRKGAIPAHKGQTVLIPMNMRDGCIIAVGKGNPEWNCSAPHGAGRICKRSEAKELFTVEEFQNEMKGIYTTTANQSTIDESPMAYKPMQEIVDLISPTVDIIRIIKPIYNFKSAE